MFGSSLGIVASVPVNNSNKKKKRIKKRPLRFFVEVHVLLTSFVLERCVDMPEWLVSPFQGSLAAMGVTSEERLLVCEVCGKEFRGRNLRQRRESHLLTHTGQRPHVCPHCPHRTALRSNLIKHIRAIHRVPPPHTTTQ